MYKKCKTLQASQRQQHMIETLIKLMQFHTFEEITISELCKHAQVPRKSFYRYFDSKDDLLTAAFDSIQHAYNRYTVSRRHPQATIREDLELFFSFWKTYSSFLQATRNSKMSSLFVESEVNRVFNERKGDRLTACFAITGLYRVLLEWAYQGFQESPKEMARRTEKLFTAPLREILFQK